MPKFHVAKAVRSNPIFGRHLRWVRHYPDVLRALACPKNPASAVAFAECVAAWQGANPQLKPDGMLGPKTWSKLRKSVGATKSPGTAPTWLTVSPEEEGWIDAIVATLRHDTKFIRFSRGRHVFRPTDFRLVATLIETARVFVDVQDLRGGNYEFRNDEPDANTIKAPRRYHGNWRANQALLIHEACHIISDFNGLHINAIEDEAAAYVVQGMFLERHDVKLRDRDEETRRLRSASRTLGRKTLDRKVISPAEWEALKQVIQKHSVYRKRAKYVLKYDGIPKRP